MNVIEAVRSGCRFKRPQDDEWFYRDDIGQILYGKGAVCEGWTDAYFLADDYIIEEREIRITRSEFWKAINEIEMKFGFEIPKLALARRLKLEDVPSDTETEK